MSRDGEIIYEIVTTKYKIAEKNRQRKFRFLCGEKISSNHSKKELIRTVSTPIIPKMDESEFKKPLDLSVPGTPVSSRYLSFIKKKGNFIEDSEDEDFEESEKNPKMEKIEKMEKSVDKSALTAELKKFLTNMATLEPNDDSNDDFSSPKMPKKVEEYFKKSDEKKSYSADFEVANNEIVVGKAEEKIKNPKIEKYFEESMRRNSFQRDFTEVYQEVKKKEQFTDLSVPGTPISSR